MPHSPWLDIYGFSLQMALQEGVTFPSGREAGLGGAPRWGPLLPQLPPPLLLPSPGPPGDGSVQADARGPRDYEDHLYVNTQGLDAPEPLQPEDSPKKDLFDMRM